MTTADILRAAKALIAEPDKWVQGYFATNKDGEHVGWHTEAACAWCADGALLAATNSPTIPRWGSCDALIDAIPSDFTMGPGLNPIVAYNDAPERTHAEIMEWFDRAIANEEKKVS
jgi:hypothetical protein